MKIEISDDELEILISSLGYEIDAVGEGVYYETNEDIKEHQQEQQDKYIKLHNKLERIKKDRKDERDKLDKKLSSGELDIFEEGCMIYEYDYDMSGKYNWDNIRIIVEYLELDNNYFKDMRDLIKWRADLNDTFYGTELADYVYHMLMERSNKKDIPEKYQAAFEEFKKLSYNEKMAMVCSFAK